MSETLSLIPNLNEMMEEYVGNEVEVTQEPLTIFTHEEILEARIETKQPTEEGKKESGGAKETETKQKQEN